MAVSKDQKLLRSEITSTQTSAGSRPAFYADKDKYCCRLIDAMVADFGLDLLQFNDEIRRDDSCSTALRQSKAADTEYIKSIYSEASVNL